MTYARLEDLPNVGPKVAARLRALGVAAPADLAREDAEALFERSSALAGHPEDPCLLDTYASAIDAANGAPARPWWAYSRERKARAAT
jgi:Pathogenicity locus